MSEKSFDVVSVGSGTLDIFMHSDKFRVMESEKVEGGVAMCEVYGGKMEVEDVVITSGGGGSNTAVSFARKDLKTACVVEMGNDPAAMVVKQDLEKEGVDMEYVVEEEDEVTAVSTILVAKEGGRSVIVYRGASAMLDKKDFPFKSLKTRWIHITSMGGRMSLLEDILSWAKRKGVRVSLNPGSSEIKERKRLLKVLKYVEILFLNKEEASRLFKLDFRKEKVWKKDGGLKSDAFMTVITDGERGGKVLKEEGWSWYEGRKVENVVDTTGAGDAFASGVVSGILYGKSYKEALNWGARNSASVVKYVGAKPGLLSLAEVSKG